MMMGVTPPPFADQSKRLLKKVKRRVRHGHRARKAGEDAKDAKDDAKDAKDAKDGNGKARSRASRCFPLLFYPSDLMAVQLILVRQGTFTQRFQGTFRGFRGTPTGKNNMLGGPLKNMGVSQH